jgi:mycothiol synthase
MSEITIRAAAPEALPALTAIGRTAFEHDAFSEQLLHEKLFAAPRPDTFHWGVLVAERDREIVGFMQHVARPAAGQGWLGLFAVRPEARRAGIATQLWEAVQAQWPDEITTAEALAIPGNYFTPGLDPRYTAGLCFLERRGFERFKDCVNLVAPLEAEFETEAEQTRLAGLGIEVRRALPEDRPLLDPFFQQQFGDDWRFEVRQAFAVEPPALHLALQDGVVIAFSAHSTQNREWGFFGPMGTTPAARGKGLGRVLLWHCLNDLRRAGHATAVIPWVGPIAFYHQWAGCRVERVFWRYRYALGE